MSKDNFFSFLDAQNFEANVLSLRDGDKVLIIGNNIGQDDEDAVIITLGRSQWEALKRAGLKVAKPDLTQTKRGKREGQFEGGAAVKSDGRTLDYQGFYNGVKLIDWMFSEIIRDFTMAILDPDNKPPDPPKSRVNAIRGCI